jgi:GAF domain-containing protein
VQVLNAAASASPHARLLETIVATAARAVRTRYGSLFLVDEDTQELVFEVSLRERIEDLRTFRLPLGRGIAGMVAITGQAIAVSDVASDPRHAAEIAQQTGYTPRNMLCVPLQSGDRVLGVLQLLDKVGNDAFTIADMEAVGLFANQAAVTIEQSSMHRSVLGLLARGLRRLAELAAGPTQAMPSAEPDFASGGPQDPAYQRALELARLVNEIAEHGEDVGKACSAVLHSLTAYVGAQPLGTAEPAQ